MTRRIFCFFLLLLAAPSLVFAQATATPDNSTAGAVTNYAVTFTVGVLDSLPSTADISINFDQVGFTLGTTMIASSPSGPLNINGGFLPANPGGGSLVTFTRDGTGTTLGPSAYTIRFGTVTNTETPGSSFTVTVTATGGTNITSDLFSINVGPITQVVIEDAAGGGSPIGSISTTTDDDSLFFAVGRDEFDNFVADVSVTWSVIGNIGAVGGFATSTTLTLDTVGSGAVSADDGSGHTDVTGTITVSVGALASIVVVEGASGDGPAFGTRSMTTDETLTLHAAGYDANGNYRSDESVTWSVTGGIGTVSPVSGTSTTFDATTVNLGTVVGTHGSVGPDATGNITVSAGALSRVRINTGATGNTAEVTTDVLTTGGTLTVHASGYDAAGNYTGDESVGWNVTGGIGNLSPNSGVSTILTATTPGTGVIEADHATVTDDATGTITVNAGILASIIIRDAPNNGGSVVGAVGMNADETLPLYAASYDGAGGTGNYLGDVSVDWSAASGNLAPAITGTSTSFIFAPTTAPASGVIRATHIASGQTDDTGTISVAVGTLSRVRINSGVSGNTGEITTQSLTADNNLTVHASGYDADGNFISDQSVNWIVTGGIGTLSVSSGISTVLDATTVGTGVILADHATAIDDATGAITVTEGLLASVVLVEGASGNGPAFGTRTVTTDQTLTLHAAGFDSDSNYTGDESVAWSVTGSIGTVSPASGTSTVFDATTVNSGTVVGAHGSVGSDATGIITVNAGALSYVQVNTGASGNTSEFTTTVLTTGQDLTVHASGYDAAGNYRSDESVSWDVTGGIGTLNLGTGVTTTLTATTPGDGVIAADHATAIDDATGTITVVAGTIASIIIRDAQNNGGSPVGNITITADTSVTFYAASYDGAGGTGNYLGDVSVTWSAASGNLAPSISGTSASFTFSPTTAPASGVVRATHSGSGQIDDTGTIMVNVGVLNRVKVLTGTTGNTGEVPDQTLVPSNTLDVHAGGFDGDDNFIGDESNINWSVSGGIGNMNPSSGATSTFSATLPGNGRIKADHPTVVDGVSGLITVTQGTVARVRIRTQPNNGGVELDAFNMTADDSLTIYAAGYDNVDNFISDVSVTWRTTPTLDATGNPVGTSFTFKPTTAPTSGQIVADHATATDDSTGTISVAPGVPVGTVSLFPVPDTLAADGSTSQITSTTILDADSNPVGTGRFFTVSLSPSSLGTITDADADPATPGQQVATNASSLLDFTFQAGTASGTVTVFVSSVGGSATGDTTIAIGSLGILSIATAPAFVTQGQTGIQVSMVVQNQSASDITNLSANLTMTGTAFGAVDRTAEYNITRTDGFDSIPANEQRTLTFDVAVTAGAVVDSVIIDGQVSGQIGLTPVSSQGAAVTDSWKVQTPADLMAESVNSPADTVAQGQPGISVTVSVSNPSPIGSAVAVVDSFQLKFLKNGVTDRSSDFPYVPDGGNPTTVAPGQQQNFNFTVNVGASADTGSYTLDAYVFGHDFNALNITFADLGATTIDQWHVKGASSLQILSLLTSPGSDFLAGSTTPWFVKMLVRNNAPDAIDIDFIAPGTSIQFIIGSDVTGEYTIQQPMQLEIAGGNQLASGATDTLTFRITQTGTTSGPAQITGRVRGIDTSTGNPVTDDTNSGGAGTVNILSASANIRIDQTNPATINPSGVVNTNQTFEIHAVVENSLTTTVENIQVALFTKNGSSVIAATPVTIDSIVASSADTAKFTVTADAVANQGGETFTSRILSGTIVDSQEPAPRGAARDSTTVIPIQTPALLSVAFTKLEPFPTASDTFDVKARVTNTGLSLVANDVGEVTLTIPSVYMLSPFSGNLTQTFFVGNEVEWRVIAPATDTNMDTFIVAISNSPLEFNTGLPAALNVGADSQAVQTLGIGLTIDSFAVTASPGAIDDTISTEQRFTMEASISVSDNIDSVRAELNLAQDYVFAPGSARTQTLTSGQTTVSWEADAPEQPHNARTFVVRMLGFDEGQVRADTTEQLEITAEKRAFLRLDIFMSTAGSRVSFGQDFQLRALVRKTGTADVEGTAELTLDLSTTGITSQEPLTRSFAPGIEVIWNVTAPSVVTPQQSISVTMLPIPDDENTNDTAAHDPQTVETLVIETGDIGSVSIDTVFVASPQGAENRILSTEQEFTITANVQWNNAVEIFARMILPTGYFAEDKTQRLTPDGFGQQDVNWTITAPVNATPAVFINIELTAKDQSNQTSDLTPDADSLAFTVVQKAELVFAAQITGPENALDRVLTVGQEFTVRADLSNAGTAGVSGDDSVAILLPSNYSTNDDLTQLISAGGAVIWTIKAPDNPTGIEVITIEIPAGKHQSRDENSKDIAPLTPNPARVTIPVQTQAVGLNVTLVNNIKPTTIIRGDTDVRIFGLAFENTSDADIDLELVSLTVKDGSSNEIAPNSVLTKLTAAELDGSTVYGTVSSIPASNKVDLVFSPALRIVSSQMASVEFRVDIATQTAESGFSLSIETPQQDIRARDTGSGEFVVIRDSLGFAMDTPQTAGISVLIDSGLEDSFFNYPNPFGSSARPNTAFNYHLVQDSEVSLRIYTLVGQLVWEVSFAANSLEGLAGTHSGEIKWDGRNGENRSVLNGVYVAVLTTNAGQAITKIAIAK